MLGFLASKATRFAVKWVTKKYGHQITDAVLDRHMDQLKAGNETLAQVCAALEIDMKDVIEQVPEQFRPLLLNNANGVSSPDKTTPAVATGSPSKPPSVEWYYKLMGQIVGPLSSSELRQHALDGKLTADTHVRRASDNDHWVSANKVKGLFDQRPTANPAPGSDP